MEQRSDHKIGYLEGKIDSLEKQVLKTDTDFNSRISRLEQELKADIKELKDEAKSQSQGTNERLEEIGKATKSISDKMLENQSEIKGAIKVFKFAAVIIGPIAGLIGWILKHYNLI